MLKEGQIVENYQGKFAKVVRVKGNHFGLSAFVGKKSDAEKEEKAVKFLNSYGIAQILKKEAKKEEKEEKKTKDK